MYYAELDILCKVAVEDMVMRHYGVNRIAARLWLDTFPHEVSLIARADPTVTGGAWSWYMTQILYGLDCARADWKGGEVAVVESPAVGIKQLLDEKRTAFPRRAWPPK